MVRELGYVGAKDMVPQTDTPNIPIEARTSRADRVGGLDFYRNRKD